MEIKPGIYKHYKGDSYLVLGVFCHTETLEKFVAYVGLSGFWIRPLESFVSEISHPQKATPRFIFIKEVSSGKVGQVLKDKRRI